MSVLWSFINNLNIKNKSKSSAFIALCCLIAGLAGFIVWFILHFFAFNAFTWVIIFTCYPAVAAWFASVIYLYNHSFDDDCP